MRRIALVLSLAVVSCARNERAPSRGPTPPASPRHPVTTRLHHIRLTDPWRWLDSTDSPRVRQWIAAQNAYADTVLASFPELRELAPRVRQLSITSPRQSSPVLVAGKLFYLRQTPPEAEAELVAQRWPGGRPWVLVNPNTSPAGGAAGAGTAAGAAAAPPTVSIVGFWPSPRGRYVAYATSADGKPETTLHVFDMLTGGMLADTITYAGGGVSSLGVLWDPDQSGFVYTRYPVPGVWFNLTLYRHTLGRSAARDSAVFGRGFSKIAEYRLLESGGGAHQAIFANVGDASPSAVWLKEPRGWRMVADTTLDVRGGGFVGDRLFLIATAGTPRGRLVAVAPDGDTATVVPQGGVAIHGVAPIAGGFLVHTLWGMRQQLLQYTLAGKLVRTVPLPEGIAIGAIASSPASSEALVTYSGWTVPERWVRYDGRTGRVTTVFEVKPAADYSQVVTVEMDARTSDGTHVPLTLLVRRGTRPDGTTPTILSAYGGFDLPVTPTFLGPWLAWIERGGAMAWANIRGGDELGERWHRQGMRRRKQTGFDDFYAAARALVVEGWTSPPRLGINGRSNGGLLMGAALTQHPGQYHAVASFVGIYDMTRHQEIPNGVYNVPEYGDAADSGDYAAMAAYSPLYRVKGGEAYPAVLMETGLNDPLVAPWQSREFTAALQWASSSDLPVLLLTRSNQGHHATSFEGNLDNTTMTMAFFAHELGLGK